MNIFNPQILWLLFLLIPICLLLVPVYLYQRKNFFLLGGQKEKAGVFRDSFLIYWTCLLSAYVFIILSWSDISVGYRQVRRSITGLEIVLVMDLSNSMLAADLPPSRLAASKTLARDIIYGLAPAKIGVVFFKGDAIVGSPLTEDKDFLTGIIANTQPQMMTAKGTNIASGLIVGNSLFSITPDMKKVIILLSDGGNLRGDLMSALRTLGNNNVTVLSVGTATLGGTEVSSMAVTGKPIYTRLEESALRTSAQSTNGAYFSYQSNVSTQIINYLEDYNGTASHLEKEPNRLSSLFILFALASLLLSLWFRSMQWKKCYSLS